MHRWLLVMFGGGVGSLLRYLLTDWLQNRTPVPFPYGTLAVNVVGCLLIGVLGALPMEGRMMLRPEQRLLLITGLLGGFTTFSSFAFETLKLSMDRGPRPAVLNFALNNALGILAAALGFIATRKAIGA